MKTLGTSILSLPDKLAGIALTRTMFCEAKQKFSLCASTSTRSTFVLILEMPFSPTYHHSVIEHYDICITHMAPAS